MINITLVGASGRMGKQIIQEIPQNPQYQLSAAICHSKSPSIGMNIKDLVDHYPSDLYISDDLDAVLTTTDMVIDFSTPANTLKILHSCEKYNKPIVIGTTGFDDQQYQIIKKTATTLPILLAPNTSSSVNLMFKILQIVAKTIGDTCDIEIIEKHHRNKLDSPSGTALKMGECIAQAMNRSLQEHAVYGRHGVEKVARDKDSIGFSSIRAGQIVGEHTALFASESEILEITHRSFNRKTYAKGALKAAAWLHHKKAGLYDMLHVLNLH